jgi:hypothetical protein
MARRADERTRPVKKAAPPSPASPTGGEDFTRAIAGNIVESTRLVEGEVATPDRNSAAEGGRTAGQTQGADEQQTPEEKQTPERGRLIAEAAYYRAERRGFAPGGEVEDWLAAEQEVEERTGKGTVG